MTNGEPCALRGARTVREGVALAGRLPHSKHSVKAAGGAIEPPKKSVRAELWEIRAAQKEQAAQPQREPIKKQPQLTKQYSKNNKRQAKYKKPKVR